MDKYLFESRVCILHASQRAPPSAPVIGSTFLSNEDFSHGRAGTSQRWYILSCFASCQGLLRWCSGKESTCQCKKCGFNPWVRKIPWSRKWQPHFGIVAWKTPWKRGAWWATVHGVAKSQKWLRIHKHTHITLFRELKKTYCVFKDYQV